MREITPVPKQYEFVGTIYGDDEITELLPDERGKDGFKMASFLTPVEAWKEGEEYYERFSGESHTLTIKEMDVPEFGAIRHGQSGFAETVREAKEEAASKDRMTLLARKYAVTGLSIEEDARLAIVTERLRELVPRVKVEDFAVLESIASFIKKMDSEHKEIRSPRKKNEAHTNDKPI